MKRSVKLSTLKELARLTRKYAATGDVDLFPARHHAADALSDQAFGHIRQWDDFQDVCEIVCGISPLKNGGTITDIIGILNLLDIEVVDDLESEG